MIVAGHISWNASELGGPTLDHYFQMSAIPLGFPRLYLAIPDRNCYKLFLPILGLWPEYHYYTYNTRLKFALPWWRNDLISYWSVVVWGFDGIRNQTSPRIAAICKLDILPSYLHWFTLFTIGMLYVLLRGTSKELRFCHYCLIWNGQY
jgi:hypothetical protein